MGRGTGAAKDTSYIVHVFWGNEGQCEVNESWGQWWLAEQGFFYSPLRRVLSVSVKFSEGLSCSPLLLLLFASPVTNYLCFLPPLPVCYSATSCLYSQYAQCVCAVPCHRVSACWWNPPVAALVSERAERSLCGLTRTAPREKRTKKEVKTQKKRARETKM